MRTVRIAGALTLALSMPVAGAYAGESVYAAHRMETPVEQIAGSVTVIERAEIERRGWRTLVDALSEVPGLQVVQAGGPGGQTSIFTRGTESNHTLLLLDGIEMSDPSLPGTVFDAAHLLTEGVERIEVVRGPQSALYGSAALGGVINVVTRSGGQRPAAEAWAEVGSFHTAQAAVRVSTGGEHGDLSLGYTQLHTRGISSVDDDLGGRERDAYDHRSLSGRGRLRLGDRAALSFVGRLVDTDQQLDPFAEDPDRRSSTRQLFTRAEAQVDLLDGRWRQRMGVSLTDHDRRERDEPQTPGSTDLLETNDGTRLQLDWQHDLRLGDAQVLSLGTETERETIDARSSSSSVGLFGPESFDSATDESARNTAFYVQHRFGVGRGLFGTVGARLDVHDDFGSATTWSASLGRVLRTGTRLHASVGTGFKAPSLADLHGFSVFDSGGFRFPFRGNPDLDPERSRSYELGIEQPFLSGRARAGVTYFNTHIRELIASNAAFDSLVNVHRARIDGLEGFVSFTPSSRVHGRVDYTYTHAENRDLDEDLLRRPKHRITAKLELRPLDAGTLSLAATYTGRRKDIDARSFENRTMAGYTTVHVAGTFRLTPRLDLFARVENLLDREYRDPDGFESRPRALFAGIRGSL